MSGGVDSSVAAALLKKQGYDVIGATMQIWPRELEHTTNSCCGLDAIDDARRVAYKLGIPHYVFDFRSVFAAKVIAEFGEEYSRGRTPNPCVRCNQAIKFGVLLDRTMELGADFIATGHYARVEASEGRCLLKKGVDHQKDQSYFLYGLSQHQLSHTLLPIGELTKVDVRRIATELELPVAAKPGSMDICFVPDDDHTRFLKECFPASLRPGPILDTEGHVVGPHDGIAFYTVGQRKGLRLESTDRRYVVALDPARDAVIVGNRGETLGRRLRAVGLNWIAMPRLEDTMRLSARIRYRHPEAEADVTPVGDNEALVSFKEPQFAMTPGQAIVFYDGEVVVGGGTIDQVQVREYLKCRS